MKKLIMKNAVQKLRKLVRRFYGRETAFWKEHRIDIVYAGAAAGVLCILPDTALAQSAGNAGTGNGFMTALGAPIGQLSYFVTKGIGGMMAAVGVGKAVYEKYTSQNQQGLGTSIGLVGGGAALANVDSLVGVTGLNVSLDASGLVFF